MELKLNIELNQIVGLIRELPYNDKLKIKHQLDKELNEPHNQDSLSLKQLLLSGPVMTSYGYENVKDLKRHKK